MLTAIYIFLFILQGITTGVFIHLMLLPDIVPKQHGSCGELHPYGFHLAVCCRVFLQT